MLGSAAYSVVSSSAVLGCAGGTVFTISFDKEGEATWEILIASDVADDLHGLCRLDPSNGWLIAVTEDGLRTRVIWQSGVIGEPILSPGRRPIVDLCCAEKSVWALVEEEDLVSLSFMSLDQRANGIVWNHCGYSKPGLGRLYRDISDGQCCYVDYSEKMAYSLADRGELLPRHPVSEHEFLIDMLFGSRYAENKPVPVSTSEFDHTMRVLELAGMYLKVGGSGDLYCAASLDEAGTYLSIPFEIATGLSRTVTTRWKA